MLKAHTQLMLMVIVIMDVVKIMKNTQSLKDKAIKKNFFKKLRDDYGSKYWIQDDVSYINDCKEFEKSLRKYLDEALDDTIRETKEEMLEVIGNDEKPDEYIAKHLTDAEVSMAVKAVEFHGRNALRAELREAIKNK